MGCVRFCLCQVAGWVGRPDLAVNLQRVHWEPDVAPTAEMWQELEQLLKTHPAKWMLWEGEPLPAVAQRLKTMGIQSVVFDPCGNRPVAGDYLSVMQQNVLNVTAE